MDFFNKAKEAAEKYTGGGDASKKDDKKKDSDSIFTKAMDAVEKYHVKDKAVEYAQKQVAKREEEKLKPGYVDKKDKSVVDKAKEAAEDFLAKQGNKQGDPPVSKPVEKPQESRPRSSSSSSSSSSGTEKNPRPKSPQATPVIVQQTTPVAPPTYPPTTANTGNYSVHSGEADCSDSFNKMNLDSSRELSSTGKYESYQEYWGRRDNGNGAQRQANLHHQPDYNAPPSYPSRVETTSSGAYYSQEVPSYASQENNTSHQSGGDRGDLFGGRENYRREAASEEYYDRSGGERNDEGRHHTTSYRHSEEPYRRSGGDRSYEERSYPSSSESGRYQSSEEYYGRSEGGARNYTSYSRDAPTSGYEARSVPGSYGGYASNDHV